MQQQQQQQQQHQGQQQVLWQPQQQQPQYNSIPTVLSPPPPPPAIPMLPPGWVTATDPVSGRLYYANATSGQTSWEPPPPTVLLPPPPPPTATATAILSSPPPAQPYITTDSTTITTTITTSNDPDEAEFPSLSAGRLADLVRIQQEQLQDDFEPYKIPLQPHALSVFGQVPHIEQGRVEIRLSALYRQLQRNQ